jgi:hypothetical protein
LLKAKIISMSKKFGVAVKGIIRRGDVEIEYRGEIDDPTNGRKVITDFLAEIGINGWKIIKRGYPWMQWNPDMKHFEE